MPEMVKAKFFPHRQEYRSTREAFVSLAFQPTAVVGVHALTPTGQVDRGDKQERRLTRYPPINVASAKATRDRMKKNGMKIPPGRQVHDIGTLNRKLIPIEPSPYDIQYRYLPAFRRAVEDFKRHWEEAVAMTSAVDVTVRKTDVRRKQLQEFVEKKVWYKASLTSCLQEVPPRATRSRIRRKTTAMAVRKALGKSPPQGVSNAKSFLEGFDLSTVDMKSVIFLDAHFRALNLEVHCQHFLNKGADVAAIKQYLFDVADSMEKVTGPGSGDAWIYTQSIKEEVLTYYSPHPVLSFDRRPYEPLQAAEHEFFPPTPHALLDFMPVQGEDWSIPGVASAEQVVEVARELFKFLYSLRGVALPPVLDRIAPNGAQDLIPMVPAITDPFKGGRFNPNSLRVRQLTHEMLRGLVMAWFEWPFRPELWELGVESENPRPFSQDSEPEPAMDVTAHDHV
jgi:transcription factor 1